MFSTATLRRLACLLLLTFTSLTLQPLQAAVQNSNARAQTAPQPLPEKASRFLDAIKDTAKRAKDQADKHQSTRVTVKELRRQKTQLDALEQDLLGDFTATEIQLKANKPKGHPLCFGCLITLLGQIYRWTCACDSFNLFGLQRKIRC